jgi:hypothetical protein
MCVVVWKTWGIWGIWGDMPQAHEYQGFQAPHDLKKRGESPHKKAEFVGGWLFLPCFLTKNHAFRVS